jgi:hypothetical protein
MLDMPTVGGVDVFDIGLPVCDVPAVGCTLSSLRSLLA